MAAIFELQSSMLKYAAVILVLALLGRFFYRLYTVRSMMRGLPGPPHHPIWGHLHLMAGVMATQPRLIAPQSIPFILKQQYNLPDLFYIDTWPLGPAMLVACHPAIAEQFTVKPSLPKHEEVARFMEPLGGGRHNLVADDGPSWKIWRSIFNPGFSATHLMTLVPDMVDEVSIFVALLQERAKKNQLFRMEKLATRLTIDIIGRVVLDTQFKSQTEEHELVSAFESQVRWMPIGGSTHPEELIEFRRPFVLWWNQRRMDRWVSRELDVRFATVQGRGKTKRVIDLALDAFMRQKGSSAEQTKTLDPEFRRNAINNIKTFIFAGHDTSSSAICYCYYHLSRNSDSLAAIRKEHDDVFGHDTSSIAELIKKSPHLLNNLPYTSAVIKEVLRLQPPASSARQGEKGFFIVDPETNERYPTENLLLLAVNIGLHRNPLWGDPDVFRPERWLTSAAPPEGAFRDAYVAFSKGPRNCIGQELALIEIRLVLAMTIRTLNFHAAYDQLHKLKGDKSGYPSDTTGVQQQFGEQAYQIQMGTAKPREGMPGFVTLVGK